MKLPSSAVPLALAVLVLIYAGLAACRTLQNFDLGWQLSYGRYLFQTGRLPHQDVFSYTAGGREWTYPAGAGAVFYLLFAAGGYPALNWLAIVTCLASVALIVLANTSLANTSDRKAFPAAGSLLLVAWAVPAIASRTGVRADMFTTLLFTATLCLLWRAHIGLRSPLYLVCILMLIWANLHQGFIFGLALFPPFIAAELIEGRRRQARSLALLLAACVLAVMANPFGWRIYSSLLAVRGDMEFQRGFIAEASPVPLGWWRFEELLRLDDPDSGFWVLAALAATGVAVAVVRRRLAPLLLLAGGLYLGLRYARGQALLAVAAAVVLPAVLRGGRPPANNNIRRLCSAGAAAVLVVLIVFHSASFAGNRYYVARGEIANFGWGLSWWFPERALDFIDREKLPGRLYNDYNLGGWTMWRLWPRYQVYIDGRAAPFMPDVFLEQLTLPSAGEAEWRAFLDRRGINTLLISLARFNGHRLSVSLLCRRDDLRLVYMDEVSGVWLRVLPENRPWLDKLARPCPSGPFPAAGSAPVERYNFLANAGRLYDALGMDGEAMRAYAEAERIFFQDPNLRYNIARIWHQRGRTDEARLEYRNSLAQRESAQAWHSLGVLEAGRGNHAEAGRSFSRAAERAVLPHESYRMAGESYLALNEPRKALVMFEKARATSRYRGSSAPLGRAFLAEVERGRRQAEEMLRR